MQFERVDDSTGDFGAPQKQPRVVAEMFSLLKLGIVEGNFSTVRFAFQETIGEKRQSGI